jgi:hypothetical protein
MDASECRKVALKAIKEARKFFGIDPAWDVALAVGTTDDGKPAFINIVLSYRQATICIDPAQCESAREVWRYMGHEVAHLVHASSTSSAISCRRTRSGRRPYRRRTVTPRSARP